VIASGLPGVWTGIGTGRKAMVIQADERYFLLIFVIDIPASDKPNTVITSDFVEYQTHRYGVFVGNASCCGALFDRFKAVNLHHDAIFGAGERCQYEK
jgi:hypothetical protein